MINEILCLVILILVAFNLYEKINKSGRLPPGPIQWPIIGNVIEVAWANHLYPHLAMAKLSKKYGEIMSLKLGYHPSVVISSFNAMKTILTKDEFIERYTMPAMADRFFNLSNPLGIIWGSGQMRKDIRRYTTRALKDFGFSRKTSIESLIQDEVGEMISFLSKKAQNNDGILEVNSKDFSASALNILWSLVAGYRFSIDDSQFKRCLELTDKQMEIFSFDNIYNVFPVLRHWFPKLTQHDRHLKIHQEVREFTKNSVEKIKKSRAERGEQDQQPLNFIELFLDEIKNKSNDLTSYYTGGSETTGTFLDWAILYLSLNPEVQKKIHAEILDNIPTAEPISLRHSKLMPYIKATIYEIQRCSSFVPMPPPRMATKDFQYENYTIPKGTCLMWNIHTVCMDQEFWGDPEQFRPERFLDDSGTKLLPSLMERVAVFGFGKRICIGESFATESIFVYLTNFMRSFEFKVIKGKEPSADLPRSAMTLLPRNYSVRICPRVDLH